MPESATETVPVRLAERSYDILVGTGVLEQLGGHVDRLLQPSRCVVVTDENVENPHGAAAASSLAEYAEVELLVIEPGEPSKCIDAAAVLWDKLLEAGVDRRSAVVAVGGGVIGDLAGFIAATYARGIAFYQVPTTLLAQVDSSVGGKVGINLPGAKNMVGAFWQPRGVLIDTAVLDTLPEREYAAGLAEVVKYGVIMDADFFGYLEDHVEGLNGRDHTVLRHIVRRSCELKADVVSQDEREETGLRAILNYGHTFCHAIETLTGYGSLLHGEAVSIGMICASRLAERMGRVDSEITRRQRDLLTALKLPVTLPPALDLDQMISTMSRDKKAEHGKLRFVLPSRMGHVELVGSVPEDDVRAVLS